MRPITPHDRDILVPLLRQAHRHNCNYSFANLCSWQRLFASEYEVVDGALVVRFNLFGRRAYLLAADPTEHPLTSVIDWMKSDAQASDSSLMIIAVEEDMAQRLVSLYGEHVAVTAIRDRYDYIYRRDDLMSLAGKDYHGKRNHANKFRSLYPDYRYQPLDPSLFDQCRELTLRWDSQHSEDSESVEAERQSINFVFDHWEQIGTIGGALFVDDRMVAFTYGGPISPTLFDTCVEKADIDYEGSYAVINQEFARHLPPQFTHINREEDMGLPGLRKAKLSYHPEQLLPCHSVVFQPQYRLTACDKERDKQEVIEWMSRQYGFDPHTVDQWIEHLHWNWPLSVKAVDPEGNTLGYLNMSDYRIEEETEQIVKEKPQLLSQLNRLNYTAVFSFIVAPHCRGTRLNHAMLMHIMPQLQQYDFLFIPVMHHLRTHRYWQRWGAREFYRDAECVYYMLPFSEAAKKIVL